MALPGPRPKYFAGPHYTYTISQGERGSASLYRVWGRAPSGDSGAEPPVRVSGAKPPEAESSLALEAPAEEPNLTLMTDLFLACCSLSVLYSERSAYVTDLSPRPSVCVRKVYCGKTADWIRMPFGVMSGVRLGMSVLDAGGDCFG